METWLRQSTAITLPFGPMLDSGDGDTEETGLTISQADIRVRKNGGSFAQTNNAAGAPHDEKGWYDVPLNTTDTNTLGPMTVNIHESGALVAWRHFMVVPSSTYDALFTTGLSTKEDVADATWDEILGGHVGAGSAGAALTDIETDVTALLAGDIGVIVSGTSDSGTTLTMVDAARTEADDDYWNGTWIQFTSGNIVGQVRLITDFDQASDTITFTPALTQAVATQTYQILPAAAITSIFGAVGSVAGNVDGSVASVTAGVTLAADAIKAVSFDETSAFPLKADDSAATQVARVGADGDTLETLSDQIDGAAVPGSAMNLVADAIKAVSYDESTAFPLKANDAAATQVARVGADSDTLETLSDQIDSTAVAGDAMNLAADAIKAVSYDESTAFPLKANDTAATQVARVGADGDTLKTLSDQIDGTASTGDAMTLANDAITLAKFDEATAFPLVASDVGATQVARVGADGDTLETLSDQIDTVAVPGDAMTLANDAITDDQISAAAANLIADHIWRRTYANVRASANGDAVVFRSAMAILAKMANRVAMNVAGDTLTVYHQDDATPLGTQTATPTPGAAPITELNTN